MKITLLSIVLVALSLVSGQIFLPGSMEMGDLLVHQDISRQQISVAFEEVLTRVGQDMFNAFGEFAIQGSAAHNGGNGEDIQIAMTWTPSYSDDGLIAPVQGDQPSPQELANLGAILRQQVNGLTNVPASIAVPFYNGFLRGGRLVMTILWWSVTFPPPPYPGKKVNTNVTQPILPADWVPFGDGTNGTLLDMSKEENAKHRPTNRTRTPVDGTVNRSNFGDMAACRVPYKSIVCGGEINSNGRLTGPGPMAELRGAPGYVTFVSSGSLCMFWKGKTKWCGGASPGGAANAPFKAYLETNGALCFYDRNDKNYACTASNSPNDGDYRLIMQDDGNLVIYRGKSGNQAIWSTHTSGSGYTSPTQCVTGTVVAH